MNLPGFVTFRSPAIICLTNFKLVVRHGYVALHQYGRNYRPQKLPLQIGQKIIYD